MQPRRTARLITTERDHGAGVPTNARVFSSRYYLVFNVACPHRSSMFFFIAAAAVPASHFPALVMSVSYSPIKLVINYSGQHTYNVFLHGNIIKKHKHPDTCSNSRYLLGSSVLLYRTLQRLQLHATFRPWRYTIPDIPGLLTNHQPVLFSLCGFGILPHGSETTSVI